MTACCNIAAGPSDKCSEPDFGTDANIFRIDIYLPLDITEKSTSRNLIDTIVYNLFINRDDIVFKTYVLI